MTADPAQAQPQAGCVGALHGYRVLDLTRVLAGPYCTQTLADLGAEVIKVENPRGGDETRRWAPFYPDGESAYFMMANRNKKSVAIDIATTSGQDLVRRLAKTSDVLVENYRAGALKKFGLDYDDLRSINPRLVYCSISGYGRKSPMAERPGYDFIAQAEGGLMSVTGDIEGEPVKTAVAVTDLFAGMNATQAILAALLARNKTGGGQHVDIALLDGQVAALVNVASEYFATGLKPKRHGNSHPSIVPYQVFRAADDYFVLTIGNDQQFATLCQRVIERPEISSDSLYATNRARVQQRDTLIPILERVFRSQPVAYWLERLHRASLPAARIRKVPDALAAPEVLAREMVQQVNHPTAGQLSLVGSPLKLSDTPVSAPQAPPLLGQHTFEVLQEILKIDTADMAELKARGVIGAQTPPVS